jgi:serine protease Do
VLREGKEQDLTVTVAEMPAQEAEAAAATHGDTWGLTVAPIDPRAARRFGIENREGVIVAEIAQGGPADEAGLRPGDVIVRIGQTQISNMSDYEKAVDALGDADRMLVLVARGGDSFFAVLQRGG